MRKIKGSVVGFSVSRRKSSLLCICLFLFGCAPNRCLQVCTPDQVGPSIMFKGVERSDKDANVDVKVLVVHGIGQADVMVPPDGVIKNLYSSDLVNGLQGELSLHSIPCSGDNCKAFAIPVEPNDPCLGAKQGERARTCGRYGYVQKQLFASPKGAKYTFYTFYWSPLSAPLKARLLGYDMKHWKYREYYNKELKETLLDQSISDAVLFAGSFRNKIEYSVKQAICYVLTDHECANDNQLVDADKADVFVISHSLGSRIVFEQLKEDGPTKIFADHLAGVFMLANQLPLLEFADQTEPVGEEEKPSSQSSLSKGFQSLVVGRRHHIAKVAAAPPVPVVAFSDPNDLLSYALPPDWRKYLLGEGVGQAEISFVNVLLQNQAFDIRTLVDYPPQAHTGYWTNPVVWKIIAHGYAGVQQRCYASSDGTPSATNTTCAGQVGQGTAAFLAKD
jgi:hypothetical protein